MFAIRIVEVPPGEAPEDVRAAWVGLVLPLAMPSGRYWHSVPVLSGPKTKLGWLLRRLVGKGIKQDGYAVEVLIALRILERTHPEAAQWWRVNAPHLAQPRRRFIFTAQVCEEIPEAKALNGESLT